MQDIAIPVSIFFDYICPFCYVASHRLEKLAEKYNLNIDWRFVEIHPDNPPEGRALSELGYPAEQWEQMTRTVEAMVAEEELPWRSRSFTTNSRKALLLAEATLINRHEQFRPLHNAIFRAYFGDGLNIGDPEVLQSLADKHGVGDLTASAWSDPRYINQLLKHVERAQELHLTGVPTLVVSDRPFVGAVSTDILEQALAEADPRRENS